MSWNWRYLNGKTLEEKVVLSDTEAENIIAVSISFKRYSEFPNSSDKDLAQIRPKRDPSLIDPYSIQGYWNGLLLAPQESTEGLVYYKYEGLKFEDANYFKSIWDLLLFDTNPQPNGTVTFTYIPKKRICDFIPKSKK